MATIDYNERFVDTLPFKVDDAKYYYSSNHKAVFISMKIPFEKEGQVITYNTLYKYSEEKGYQYLKSIDFGNIIEISDSTGKMWLYTSDLRYKIDLESGLKAIYCAEAVEFLNYFGITNLDNMIVYKNKLHIFFDDKHYVIGEDFDTSSPGFISENLPGDIDIRLGIFERERELRILGINSPEFGAQLSFPVHEYSWTEKDKFVQIDNNISEHIPYDSDIMALNFYAKGWYMNSYVISAADGKVWTYNGSDIYPIEKGKDKVQYTLKYTPLFTFCVDNNIHYFYKDELGNISHSIIIRYVNSLGRCTCRFPVKLEAEKLYLDDDTIITDDIELIKSDNYCKFEKELYYGARRIGTIGDEDKKISVNNDSICRCVYGRYIVVINRANTDTLEPNIFLYDLNTDTLQSIYNPNIRYTNKSNAEVFYDLQKLYYIDNASGIENGSGRYSLYTYYFGGSKVNYEKDISFLEGKNVKFIKVLDVYNTYTKQVEKICVCVVNTDNSLNLEFAIFKNSEFTKIICYRWDLVTWMDYFEFFNTAHAFVDNIVTDGYFIYVFGHKTGDETNTTCKIYKLGQRFSTGEKIIEYDETEISGSLYSLFGSNGKSLIPFYLRNKTQQDPNKFANGIYILHNNSLGDGNPKLAYLVRKGSGNIVVEKDVYTLRDRIQSEIIAYNDSAYYFSNNRLFKLIENGNEYQVKETE